MLKHIILLTWVVFTTESQIKFQEKLNSLPSYAVWDQHTRIMQSGDWPKYTIIYWKK